MLFRTFFGVAILSLLPLTLSAQFPVPLVLEARAGYAIPSFGTSGEGTSIEPEGGLSFAVGGRFGLNAMIAAHLGRWGPSVRDTVELLASEPVAELASAVDYMSVEPTAPP